MKLKLVTITLALSLNAIASADCVKDSITAAKNAQKEAQSIHFEWRDMGAMIKKAEALANEGKTIEAKEIADKVVAQLDAIKMQAQLSKTAGPTF